MQTPIILLTFNRPDLTAQVLDALRSVRAPVLFVSSDGPRPDRPDERSRVAAVRKLIEDIDWPCESILDFAEVNEGCGRRVSTALSRAFERFAEAIILEDDCLPHPDFFRFCEEMLARYRHDERIMHVGGNNFWADRHAASSSYVFSRYTHVWGWATWRRAWARYDFRLSRWPELRSSGASRSWFRDPEQAAFWARVFDDAYLRPTAIDTWDYQWLFTSLAHDGLAVYPARNLVSNVGFRSDATHTTEASARMTAIPTRGLSWPLVHPRVVAHDVEADRANFAAFFRPLAPPRASLLQRARALGDRALGHRLPAASSPGADRRAKDPAAPSVLHVSWADLLGGAARAAYRIHRAVLEHSPGTSRMRVLHQTVDDWTVTGGPPEGRSTLQRLQPRLARWRRRSFTTENPVQHSLAWPATGLGKELGRADADIFHLHWLGDDTLSIEEIGQLDRPVVWTLHDQWVFCGAEHYVSGGSETDDRFVRGYATSNRPAHESGPDLNRETWERKRRAWRTPMHIVTPSTWLADCARRSALLRGWPIDVIPHPLDLRRWAPMEQGEARRILGLPREERVALFGAVGGTSDPRKGAILLFEALRRLEPRARAIGAFRLAVFGQSRPERSPELPFPIEFFGKLHDDISLRLLYAAADVLVVPSLQEAFGQTASEAHACGTPVVAWRSSGLTDVIEDRVTGALAEPFDPGSLAAAIAWVVEDPSRRRQLGAAARARAEALWAPDVVARQYAQVYRAALMRSFDR